MKYLRTEDEIIKTWGTAHSQPVVSVCCITYNHEKYIEDALEGFLIQETDFPIEILIHDDASTDRTKDIIKDYCERYPRLIKPIFQTENQYSKGYKINLEFNLPRAKGKYIALCEGDDYWTDPLKLKIQTFFLNNNPEYVITYHDSVALLNGTKITNEFIGSKRDLTSYELKTATPIYTLTACFRNLIHSHPPEINAAKMGDKCIWSLLGNYGDGKFISEIKPSVYRIHQGGVFSQKNFVLKQKMSVYTSAALSSYYDRTGEKQLSEYFMRKTLRSVFEISPLRLLVTYLAKTIVSRLRRRIRNIRLVHDNHSAN